MLFRKDIEPKCAYCRKSRAISDRQVVCPKRGVVESGDHCGAFEYDPLRRVPSRPVKLDTEKLQQEDFNL